MAKVTLFFAVLLIALGLVGFLGTGHTHYTALIPALIGLAFGVFGWLAISPDQSRRMHFMHINATISILGFLGTTADLVHDMASLKPFDPAAMGAKLALMWLLFFYLFFCVIAFSVARRSEKV